MRAAIYERYGPPEVVRLAEVETPAPRSDELLIKIIATTVNRTDCGHRRAHPFFFRAVTGLTRPKAQILGSELAGEVTAVGAEVTLFAPGDTLFGVTPDGMGAHAQFVCVPQGSPLATMPAGTTFEEAASVPMGMVQALTCLRSVRVQHGQRVLIYGASGSVGTASVQLAKHLGAHVTAVCNTPNLALVRSLGADEVIDYLREDFTRNGMTYDVVFDAVGKHSFRRCRRSLVRGGAYVVADLGFLWQNPFLALLTTFVGTKRVRLPFDRDADSKRDIEMLSELMSSSRYRAVIDRTYPLEAVVEATRYVETGQKSGNVVLTISHDPSQHRSKGSGSGPATHPQQEEAP